MKPDQNVHNGAESIEIMGKGVRKGGLLSTKSRCSSNIIILGNIVPTMLQKFDDFVGRWSLLRLHIPT